MGAKRLDCQNIPTGAHSQREIRIDRWRLKLMRKTQEEPNEAGTFDVLVTLKKHERCEKPQKDGAD